MSEEKETQEKNVISEETGIQAEVEISEDAETDGKAKKPKKMKQATLFGKPMTQKEMRIRTAISFLLMSAGVLMMSISVYFFQTPNSFTLGGVAGISLVLSKLVPVNWLSQGVFMAIINVAVLILGLVILGKQCTLKTIYCSLLYTGLIWLFEFIDILGLINGTPTPSGGIADPMTDETFLEFVYMILFFGVGAALVFNCGASTGGTDIIALIIKKFTKLNVGTSLLIIDLIVVCAAAFMFTNLETALFSFLALFLKSFLLDGVIESIVKTKYITIITTKPDEISKYILEVIQHGCTQYDAQGAYTKKERKILITVCRRNEALKLKAKVKELDPDAFVIITDANEILGKGFGGNL